MQVTKEQQRRSLVPETNYWGPETDSNLSITKRLESKAAQQKQKVK
jgi:hypothetical protein